MSKNRMWMGRPIEELDRRELAAALEAALRLLRSVPSASLVQSDVEVRETANGVRWHRTAFGKRARVLNLGLSAFCTKPAPTSLVRPTS
jgi:hypothetical protein